MNKFNEWWKSLDAKKRQLIFVGTFVIIGFGCLFFIMDNTGQEKSSDPNAARVVAARDVVTKSFTGANTREMDIHGMAQEMNKLQRTVDNINTQFDNMARRMDGREKAQQEAVARSVQDAKASLARQTMTLLEDKYGRDFGNIQNLNDRLEEVMIEASLAAEKALAASEAPGKNQQKNIPTPAAQYRSTHKVDWEQEAERTKEEVPANEKQSVLSGPEKITLGVVTNAPQQDSRNEITEKITLPGNTIFHGVLLTGAVVPVGKDSEENPVPVLMRVKEDAILANNFSADVKECFLSASGTGDLSSERVEFRAERLVCIREDGGVLETPIEMWSVGEDGMAGVRGKLVHKAGALVAQATLAATVDSFAKMFSAAPVPTLSTTASGETLYQQAMSSDALQAASMKGISGGMDRLTEYLMDLADEILPVLEVHALREIGFVMVKGQTLEFKETVSPVGLTTATY